MYLLLARASDRDAVHAASCEPRLVLVTPQSLATTGWRYTNGRAESGAVGGVRFDPSAVCGMVVRLAGITPLDLNWIRAADQNYAAQEITAFLLAWLSAMPPGSVISAPAGAALAGWSPLAVDHAVDQERAAIHSAASLRRELGRVTVNVVARAAVERRSVFATVTETIASRLGVAELRATYWANPFTTAVDLVPWPDIADPAVRQAILSALDDQAKRCTAKPLEPAVHAISAVDPQPGPDGGSDATRPVTTAGRRVESASRPPRVAIWGRTSDTPTAVVLAELRRRGIDCTLLADTDTTSSAAGLSRPPVVRCGGQSVDIASFTAHYPRPYELCDGAALTDWLDHTDALVVNRPAAARTNNSKPLQAQLIASHFACPRTLITTDIDEVRGFLDFHGRVIYKSMSGTRSIVATLRPDDPRLYRPLQTPLQVQEWVPGPDLRIHVVGRQAFTCRIDSAAVDYRYAGDAGADMSEVTEPDVAQRAVELVHTLGMVVGGIDLRRRPDGEWVCFEVNPSPAFTAFDYAHHGAIAHALVDLLTGHAERE